MIRLRSQNERKRLSAAGRHDQKDRRYLFMKCCPVFPFDALPDPFRALCAETAMFDSDRPEISAIVALTTLAGAIGPSTKIRRMAMDEEYPGGLFVIIQSSGQVGCLSRILQPLVKYQRECLGDRSYTADLDGVRSEEARIRRRRDEFLRFDRCPEEAHVDYFQNQLRKIDLQRRRLFHLANPSPGSLARAFDLGADGSIFAAWTNPDDFAESISFWASHPGKSECELIRRALHQEMFIGEDHAGASLIIERPSLAGLALCRPETLGKVVGNASFLLSAESVFVITAEGRSGKPNPSLTSIKGAPWWQSKIADLLQSRFEGPPSTFSLSPGAAAALFASDDAFRAVSKLTEASAHALINAALRLVMPLHVCHDNPPGGAITEATALGAIQIAGWLVAERARILAQIENEARAKKRQKDCAIMLQKIQDKAPVSKRDLFHSYDVQGQAIQGPILEELINSGKVAKDDDGLLCAVVPSKKKAGKTSPRAMSHCRTASPASVETGVVNEPI
jgi:hypothetical protein